MPPQAAPGVCARKDSAQIQHYFCPLAMPPLLKCFLGYLRWPRKGDQGKQPIKHEIITVSSERGNIYLSTIYLDKDIPWVTEFACVYYISCSLAKDRAVCYCRLAKCNGRRSTPATQLVTALFHKSYKSSVSVTQQIPIKETNKRSKTKQKKHTHTKKKIQNTRKKHAHK